MTAPLTHSAADSAVESIFEIAFALKGVFSWVIRRISGATAKAGVDVAAPRRMNLCMLGTMKSCYMCDRVETSKEHVPPQCFFPERKDLPSGLNYRVNLITVPSCDTHNSSKSNDDQYLLMVILSYYDNNISAQRHFSKKMMRAIRRRASLLGVYASGLRPAVVDGRPTAAFAVDRNRFDKSFEHITRALYFHHSGEKWTEQVTIQTPVLFPVDKDDYQEIYRGVQDINLLAEEILQAEPKLGSNQEIFYYQIQRDEQLRRLLVKMVFYQGFVVIAYSSPAIDWT